MKKITLKEAIREIKMHRDLFRYDLKDKEYGERARLLLKHYNNILQLLRNVKN